MCIRFAFKEAAPRHYGVGVVPSAVTMLHRILKQRLDIGLNGLLKLGASGQTNAPGLCKGDSLGAGSQRTERQEPAGLGKDSTVETTTIGLGRSEVVLGVLLKLGHALLVGLGDGLNLEGDVGIKRTHVHVLGVAQPAVPQRFLRAEHHLVQESHTGRCLRHLHPTSLQQRKPLQQHGGDHGR